MSVNPPPVPGTAVSVVIEVPRWSCVKRGPQGAVDFVSPLPCPYNYGSVLGTLGEDGDPLDAVVMGPREPFGAVVTGVVQGCIDFVDAGVPDPKFVVSVTGLEPKQRLAVARFFVVYAAFKRFAYGFRRHPQRRSTRSFGWCSRAW